jgi:hypothetical protein
MHAHCPKSLKQCTLVNVLALLGFLAAWAMTIWLAGFAPFIGFAVLIIAFCFPVLVILSLVCLRYLSGWRQVISGAFLSVVIWFGAFCIAFELLGRIAGPK